MSDTQTPTALATSDQAGHPVVSEEVLSAVVSEINTLARQAPLDLALAIGKLVVDRCYNGDVGAWRSRGAKDASIRKLAEHPALEISASGLFRSLAVYELGDRVGVSVLKQAGATRVYAVLGLPHEKQTKLLEVATAQDWTADKLEQEARKARKGGKGGRRPLPRFVKTIHQMNRFAEGGDDLFADLDAIEGMEPDTVMGLYKTVTGVKQRCEELQHRLEQWVPVF